MSQRLPPGMGRAINMALLAARTPKRHAVKGPGGGSARPARFLRVGLWLPPPAHQDLLKQREADGMADVSLHHYVEWRLNLRSLDRMKRRVDKRQRQG